MGLDILQVPLDSLLLSHPDKEIYARIYLGVFIFLLSSVVLISYLWYNRSVKQTQNWKAELEYVRKLQFSDAARGMRRLEAQKAVLQRAYSSKYISKATYESAINEIDRLSSQLKKRL
jgi:hypothetical protein